MVKDFPIVQVRDQAEYKQEQSSQINRLLVLFYVLLGLAVVIAMLGAILGLVVGTFFGWTLAAVLPGRRAARVDMPLAIATD